LSVEIIVYGNPLKGSKESVRNANIELLSRVTATAKSLCPVDTGFLKSSIMWKVPGQDGGHQGGEVLDAEATKDGGLVGSAMEYAIYVEFGTRKMGAQPYLRPAILLEIYGPNGQNTMKEETIKAMAHSLKGQGRKFKSGGK